MPDLPDLSTLRLCSCIANMTAAMVFLALWRGRRDEMWWFHWAVSPLVYALSLLTFEGVADAGSPPLMAAAWGLLALSNATVLAGVRRFDGQAGFTPAMWGMTIVVGAGGAFTSLMPMHWPRVTIETALLILTALFAALPVLRHRPDDGTRIARPIVGLSLLAYVPGYLVAMAGQLGIGGDPHWLAMVPVLADQFLLNILNLALLALPGLRLQSRLRDLAMRDPLTGAWNRAGLAAHEAAWARAGHAVLLADVDRFKGLNDRHGHATGDAVLAAVARTLADAVAPAGGHVVRLGGDEFMAVVPATRIAEAVAGARRIAPAPGLPDWSISIGQATATEGEATLSAAMARADDDLYRAKRHGQARIAA